MSVVDISVFIVNYNGAAFIAACLDSIYQSEITYSYEVIVVDNLSTDDSVDVLKHSKHPIKLIESSCNLGFSRGNNCAFAHSEGRFVFLLNNDTVLRKNTLEILANYLKDNPKVGAITPKLCNADGSLQAPGSMLGKWRFKQPQPIKVPFIAGAAVLMPRNVYEQIGGLDPNLFFYNDDIDMCKMIHKHGYEIHYVPTSELTHFGGLSTQFRKIGSLIEGYRGGLYICYKHYGSIAYFIYRFLVLIDILPRLVIHSVLGVFSSNQRAFSRAYLTVLGIDFTGDIFLKKSNETRW